MKNPSYNCGKMINVEVSITTSGGSTRCDICILSNDKLKPYGTVSNGCTDKFSGDIMCMETYFPNCDPKVKADYFINTVTLIGGCPQQVGIDPGRITSLFS